MLSLCGTVRCRAAAVAPRAAAPSRALAAAAAAAPPSPPGQQQPPPPTGGPLPFIDRARLAGVNALLGKFITTEARFDRVLEGLHVTRLDPATGEAEATLTVHEGLINAYGGLHGGATCTIVDVVTTIALLGVDPLRAGVSVDLNVSFTAAAKLGEPLRIVARVLRTGKRLGFTEAQIFRASDGVLVATGRHTKAL